MDAGHTAMWQTTHCPSKLHSQRHSLQAYRTLAQTTAMNGIMSKPGMHRQGSNFEQHTNLWVDDLVASLVKEGQQLLVYRALLGVTAGWAHHAGDAGGGVHHLAG